MLLERKKNQESEAFGRSKGGFSTKIHLAVDSKGCPVKFIFTPGQQNDICQAQPLIEGEDFHAVIADKGYDCKALVEAIEVRDAKAVIPSRSNSIVPRNYDVQLYKNRNLVERAFNFLKHFRRVATRYDKTIRNFSAFVHLATMVIWLI